MLRIARHVRRFTTPSVILLPTHHRPFSSLPPFQSLVKEKSQPPKMSNINFKDANTGKSSFVHVFCVVHSLLKIQMSLLEILKV